MIKTISHCVYNGFLSMLNSKRFWYGIALGFIIFIALSVNFIQLQKGWFLNLYYAAAVKSMLINRHNFFFAAFDPAGFLSIDKPPLGFWLQVVSVKLFGFSTWTLLLPEALAGFFSIILLYHLVYRTFGVLAALLAALIFALTPIMIVINHTNSVDSILICVLLLATWCITLATETGHLRWLLLCSLFLGVGFNIKTLQAYLILPAFFLAYLLGSQRSWYIRFLHIIVSGLCLFAISFFWITIVDMTSTSQRPYISSTITNSEMELTLSYNGFERLFTASMSFQRTQSLSNDGGVPSLLRLFKAPLGGQIGWLLALALLGLPILYWRTSFHLPLTKYHQTLILWGGWLLTAFFCLSYMHVLQAQYLSLLAPPLSYVAGVSIVLLWKDYRLASRRGWLLPLALCGSALIQVTILLEYPTWYFWLIPFVVSMNLFAVIWLILARIQTYSFKCSVRISKKSKQINTHFSTSLARKIGVIIGILALLVVPVLEDSITLKEGSASSISFLAGPASNEVIDSGFISSPGTRSLDVNNVAGTSSLLFQYLERNQHGAHYLVSTLDAYTAAPIILETGKPVLVLGGYLGSDPILTQPQLISLIKHHTIHFFLFPGLPIANFTQPPEVKEQIIQNMFRFAMGNEVLVSWVIMHCESVSEILWQSSSDNSMYGTNSLSRQLYDCTNYK